MDGLDLFNEQQSKIRQLDYAVKQLRKSGSDYAQAEHDYKVLLREEVLRMRNDGMAVGIISLTCYGVPSVATARLKRDCAEAVYKANLEAINSIKLQLRIIENQIQREM